MPRGGKRPGAGAPRGNFNRLRSLNRSDRAIMVYFAFLLHPDWSALARELHAVGLLPARGRRFDRQNARAVVRYLHGRWFDCPDGEQSNSIKDNQTQSNHPLPRGLLTLLTESAVRWIRAGMTEETVIALVMELNQTARLRSPPRHVNGEGAGE